jgi:chemotaxis protein MotB
MSRSKSRAKHGAGEEEEPANEERWMASYMDMVTVVMCTFIVLFSMSTINNHKFDELKNSLQTGFGIVKSQKVDTAKGVVVPPKDVQKVSSKTPTPLQLARSEVNNLQKLEQEINARLSSEGLAGSVSYTIDARGLTIGLVGNQTFFDSNVDTLTPIAIRIIDTIGPILNATTYKLSIEGHADLRPAGPPYATNWDLAAARAIAVLRRLTEQNAIAVTRVSAVSYGSAQATAAITDPVGLSKDRRVDIVVLSSQTEDVRSFIPQVLASEAAAGGEPTS